jgi:hypothetical protein
MPVDIETGKTASVLTLRDGGGLYLVIKPSGVAKWVAKVPDRNGKFVACGLGSIRRVLMAAWSDYATAVSAKAAA